MRYPHGEGLTAERQAFRERVWTDAMPYSLKSGAVRRSQRSRVSVRSVQWWRAWREAGQDAVRSRVPASHPKLSDVRFAVLEAELL